MILIEGGRILDGLGGPSFTADLLIRRGRVDAIGRVSPVADLEAVDCSGLAIAPAFVDEALELDHRTLVRPRADAQVAGAQHGPHRLLEVADGEAAARELLSHGSAREVPLSYRTRTGEERRALAAIERLEVDGVACLLTLIWRS